MNVETFAEWLRRQGHQIITSPSGLWCNQGPRAYELFPYDRLIEPEAEEIGELLQRARGVGVRYSAPLTATTGRVSYHVVREGSYGMEHLSASARSKVRRGLKQCNIAPITQERLAEDGWRLQHDTLLRQGRPDALTREHWQRICRAGSDLPGFEAWGAFVNGELGSAALVGQVDATCFLLYVQSHRQYLGLYVNNALIYTLTQTLLARADVRTIFYGVHSLDAPASVDTFKFGMGYTPKPVRQQIAFHPWLAPLFNRTSHAAVKQIARRYPHHLLSKTQGMLEFYLEGKRAPQEQHWPECLAGNKAELLQTLDTPSAYGTPALLSGD